MYLKLNRRDFSRMALAAAAAPLGELFAAKPNSIFDGVVIGTITYSFRSETPAASQAEPLLKMVVDSGISNIELMPPAAEAYAGSPAPAAGGGGGARGGSGIRGGGGAGRAAGPAPSLASCAGGGEAAAAGGGRAGGRGGSGGGGGRGGGRGQMSPEQQAAADALKQWRLSVSMDKFKEFGKMYSTAGVNIYCHKLSPGANASDPEFDYYFNIAKAMGAGQISLEESPANDHTQKLGDFAAKHGMMTAYHAHTQATITAWDGLLQSNPKATR